MDGGARDGARPEPTTHPSSGRLAADASVPGRWAQDAVDREQPGGERYGQEDKQDHAQARVVLGGVPERPKPTRPQAEAQGYEREMRRLHGELVAMQEWVKASGAKICIVFEGRDTAGKGARSSGSPSG